MIALVSYKHKNNLSLTWCLGFFTPGLDPAFRWCRGGDSLDHLSPPYPGVRHIGKRGLGAKISLVKKAFDNVSQKIPHRNHFWCPGKTPGKIPQNALIDTRNIRGSAIDIRACGFFWQEIPTSFKGLKRAWERRGWGKTGRRIGRLGGEKERTPKKDPGPKRRNHGKKKRGTPEGGLASLFFLLDFGP